jgi:L-fuculose-phosphate aldolase
MMDRKIVSQLSDLSLTMFRKNFFGIYHGAISAKIDHNTFLINTADAIFDEMGEKYFCELGMYKKDYRWNIASIEASIHSSIYVHIHEAKYVAFGVPIYTTAYTFDHDKIVFNDYFGKTTFGELPIIDPGLFSTWYDRNALLITKYLKESNSHVMVIKGIGVYIYDRDINELVKKVAILENSCRLLSIKSSFC